MYVDVIACYFVTCIMEKLFNKSKSEYKKNLIYFRNGYQHKEYRTKMYKQILSMINEDKPECKITYKDFLHNCINDFYTEFEVDENNNFSLFDKTMLNAVNEWITFLLIYEVDNILSKKNHIEARTKFIYYLSIAISQISMSLNGEEIEHSMRNYKILLDYVKSSKTNKIVTKDASTQT